jgi:carbamoyl-phosphate synthase small subunit
MAIVEERKKALLVLEDGTVFLGEAFGAEKEVSGEVVFNTSMYGYPELLTDPSYYEQIVVMTYPIVGSYGVSSYSSTDKYGVPLDFESDSIKVKGYAVHALSRPSHWSSVKSLDDWLQEQGIPGIMGIDTRALAQRIRTNGTMLGLLRTNHEPFEAEDVRASVKRLRDPNASDLVSQVTVREPVEYKGQTDQKVVVVDCGTKFGIVRSLLASGVSVVRVPYDYDIDKILDFGPCGIVLSNGPGDPMKCEKTIKSTAELLSTDVPIMGICLGSQILALAAGARTYKLKFGHRAVNHPCMDLETGRCHITTQNHGYSVDESSLEGTGFQVSFVNVNDKSVEGIRHKTKKVFGVQWHPESSPGPQDTRFLFNRFLEGALRP